MKNWKRLSRERVFDHKYFKVNKDVVRLQDGTEIDWLFWDANDSTMVVAETPKGQLVMIMQYRYLPNEVALEFPSGGSNDGEALDSCALREFEEETGYTADDLVYMGGFFETMAQLNKRIHLYYATNAKKLKIRKHFNEATENIDVVLVDPSKLESEILNGQIHSMGTAFAYFMYKELKEKNARTTRS